MYFVIVAVVVGRAFWFGLTTWTMKMLMFQITWKDLPTSYAFLIFGYKIAIMLVPYSQITEISMLLFIGSYVNFFPGIVLYCCFTCLTAISS